MSDILASAEGDHGGGMVGEVERAWRETLGIANVAEDVDFFALGGTPEALMAMQKRIEARTGRRFNPEVFATRPSFAGLIEQMGLGYLDPQAEAEREFTLSFRLVRRAMGESRGAVLCMPGITGRAEARSYADADMLADHDLWGCDVTLPWRASFDPQLWIAIARAIAARISAGTAPPAQVLIGFSASGYVAWLVGRFLASSPGRPERIIAFDTVPLHRSKRDSSPALTRAVNALPAPEITMLSIRREVPPPFVPDDPVWGHWSDEDGPIVTLLVPVIEHRDLHKPAVLAATRAHVERYVASGAAGIADGARLGAAPSLSGEVCAMLACGNDADVEHLRALLRDEERFGGRIELSGLLYLALAFARLDEARGFCATLLRLHPDVVAFRYARHLLRRIGHDAPVRHGAARAALATVQLPSALAYEMALCERTGRAPEWLLWRWCLMARAFIEAFGPVFARRAFKAGLRFVTHALRVASNKR